MSEVVHESLKSSLISLHLQLPFSSDEYFIEADKEGESEEEETKESEKNVKPNILTIDLKLHLLSLLALTEGFLNTVLALIDAASKWMFLGIVIANECAG